MSGDQDGLPLLSAREDFFLEVRDEASDDVLQALRLRDRVKVGVARVVGLRVLRAVLELWRAGVVGTTPCHELFVTVLFLGIGFVQALQRTVVTLVQAPVADDRDPQPVSSVEGNISGADSPS